VEIESYRFASLALGLEGMLVSDAASRIPRPGLYRFLEHCDVMFDEVVVFTTVPEAVFRAIAERLAEEGYAPQFFGWTRHVHSADGRKDLDRVSRFGGTALTLLVDHSANSVVSGQEASWVCAPPFEPPYSDGDIGLTDLIPELARGVLTWRWGKQLQGAGETGNPGLPDALSSKSLATHKEADLLTLLAGASGVTADRRDAVALLSELPAAFGGKTALEWVRAGRSDVALQYLACMRAGALG
jgi:hypothetical protein